MKTDADDELGAATPEVAQAWQVDLYGTSLKIPMASVDLFACAPGPYQVEIT